VLASLVCAPVRAGGGGGGFGASDSIIFVLLRRGFGRAPPRCRDLAFRSVGLGWGWERGAPHPPGWNDVDSSLEVWD
jgi:hypothetical protein